MHVLRTEAKPAGLTCRQLFPHSKDCVCVGALISKVYLQGLFDMDLGDKLGEIVSTMKNDLVLLLQQKAKGKQDVPPKQAASTGKDRAKNTAQPRPNKRYTLSPLWMFCRFKPVSLSGLGYGLWDQGVGKYRIWASSARRPRSRAESMATMYWQQCNLCN